MHRLLTYLLAAVWLVNGLYCKVLNGVPRHQLIVVRILGADHGELLTKAIGFGEVLMAVWVLSQVKPRWCAITQIALVATMNLIEFVLAPDLLLYGRFNAGFAGLFIGLVYYWAFGLRRPVPQPPL